MTDPVPSKERIGFLIDYWTAKLGSHRRWPEGQGIHAELLGLIYDHTIAALKHLHSAPEPGQVLCPSCGRVRFCDPKECGLWHGPAQPPPDVRDEDC